MISRRYFIKNNLVTKTKVLAILAVSLVIAIFVLTWANEKSPIYRPLIQDLRLIDSVKISDVLDQERIYYYADVKNHILYVNQEQSDLARVALAKIGIVINYPEIIQYDDLHKAYDEFIKQQKESEVLKPLWQQLWFLQVVKMIMGTLVVITLIVSVIRPALKKIVIEEEQ